MAEATAMGTAGQSLQLLETHYLQLELNEMDMGGLLEGLWMPDEEKFRKWFSFFTKLRSFPQFITKCYARVHRSRTEPQKMPIPRQLLESVAEGFKDNLSTVFRAFTQLVESVGGDLYAKITVVWKLMESIGRDLYNRTSLKFAAFRQSVEAITKDLDDKMIVFRGREFVQSIVQGLAFITASILFNLIGNYIWNAVQNKDVQKVSGFMVFFHYIPLSFVHYLPLTIMTLILWGVGNHFFMKLQYTGPLPVTVVGLHNPHSTVTSQTQTRGLSNSRGIGPSNPEGPGPSDPQVTGRPDLGILDDDLRLFFYHLRKDYSLPAPEMVASSCIKSIAWAEASPGKMALTVHIEGAVTEVELVYKPVVTLPCGSKILYRRFEVGPGTGIFELEALRKLVLESMSQARTLDPGCTLQFGSFAVLKYTDAGLKWWRLQEHWTPSIYDIRQSPRNLVDSLYGYSRKCIIRGRNLQTANFKASTRDEVENLQILHRYKVWSGEDELLCEEPQIIGRAAPIFRKQVYICASNSVEVEDGVVFNVQSEPLKFTSGYWIFGLQTLIPSRWTTIMIFTLSLLGALSHVSHERHHNLFPKFAWGYVKDLEHEANINSRTNLETNAVLLHTWNELYKFFLVYTFVIVVPISVSTLWQFLCDQISLSGYDFRGLRRTTTLEDTTTTRRAIFETNLLETASNSSSLATQYVENLNQLEDTSTSSLPTVSTTSPPNDNSIPPHFQREEDALAGPSEDVPVGQHLSKSYDSLDVQGLAGRVKDPKYKLDNLSPNKEIDHLNPFLNPLINPFLNEELDNVEKKGFNEKYGVCKESNSTDPSHDILSPSSFQTDSRKESRSRDAAASYDHIDAKLSGNNLSSNRHFPGRVDFDVKNYKSDSKFQDIEHDSHVLPPPPPPPLPPLPPEWKEAFDFESGYGYYYNPETNQSTWERPKMGTVIADQDKKPEPSSTGPRELPSYTAPSDFQKPARCESRGKGKQIVEHGDDAFRSQPAPSPESCFGDSLAGSDFEDASDVSRVLSLATEGGWSPPHSGSSTSSITGSVDFSTEFVNVNRSDKKTCRWEAFSFSQLGGRAIFHKRSPMMELEGIMPVRFSYKQLSMATGGFCEESRIGHGGFARVYKGILPSGIQIAVKKLSDEPNQRLGLTQFKAEVSITSQLRHRNLVQLLGWSEDSAKKEYLVYELMPNGTLNDFLFKPVEEKVLSWPQRFEILKGTAAGLDYLHSGWKQQVIHRDVKSSNIMLDNEYNAKLADLGNALIVAHGIKPEETGIWGTPGYIAPEVVATSTVTTKADVYGFGVVVLEVVCARRTLSFDGQPGIYFVLLDWVWQRLKEGDLWKAVDPQLKDCDTYWVEAVLKIGLLCSLSNPAARPSMKQVVQMLAGDMPVPTLPPSKDGDTLPDIPYLNTLVDLTSMVPYMATA